MGDLHRWVWKKMVWGWVSIGFSWYYEVKARGTGPN